MLCSFSLCSQLALLTLIICILHNCYFEQFMMLIKLLFDNLFYLLFRYNTFSPDTVKKMPRADLVEEVRYCFLISKSIATTYFMLHGFLI